MPSRRAGAHLVPLRQADEGFVWGRPLPVPKAVRTDFRALWIPGNAPFSRGRKLGQGNRGVELSESPWGICLADHGTGIITALRKGADELTQAIRVPTQAEACGTEGSAGSRLNTAPVTAITATIASDARMIRRR